MEKRQEVELLRILSAFGIIWFHTSAIGKDIAYSGLIAFLIISMYFSAKPSLKPKTLSERAKRLLVPWVMWLFFYGMINIVVKKTFINTDNGLFFGILAGTSIHLWYMAFIFMAIVLFDLIKKYINGQKLAYICFFFIIFIFAMTEIWRPWSSSLVAPWGQYFHALNGVLIGVFFANCGTMPRLLLAGFILLMLMVAVISTLFVPGVGVPYIIGIIVTSLTLLPRWNFHPPVKMNWLSDCTFGIYLSHPFWVLVIDKFRFSSGLSLPFLVFAISAISVWFLKRVTPSISKYVV